MVLMELEALLDKYQVLECEHQLKHKENEILRKQNKTLIRNIGLIRSELRDITDQADLLEKTTDDMRSSFESIYKMPDNSGDVKKICEQWVSPYELEDE